MAGFLLRRSKYFSPQFFRSGFQSWVFHHPVFKVQGKQPVPVHNIENQIYIYIYLIYIYIPSLELTAKGPENGCEWKIPFLLGAP